MSNENLPTESYHGSQAADRLDAVLADYLQDIEEGRPPNRDSLLARHPDLAEEMREFFADRDLMKARVRRVVFIVPKFVGDYQLLEEIGSGTFGVVVKARNINADKLVAIKLLRGEQWSSPEYVQRFKTEARKQAKLDHPHIVPVNHLGEHEGQQYFVMKLIEGGSLTQRLRGSTAGERSTRRHQRWAAELIAKIAQAVHYAHQHAIIHRDLKPHNILLDAEGQPHITDFGLAKQLEEGEQLFELGEATCPQRERFGWEGGPEADTVMTEKGLIVGTAPYMSPEQAAGAEVSTASDVWSLGVILYEMLTDQVPIRGPTPQETMRLIQQQTPPPLRFVNSRIDYRLEKICLKCLQRNPLDRYGSALGLARNLERWLANEPIIDPPDSIGERCRLWCRRNPALAGLLVTAAALFLFVSTMVVWESRVRAERLEEEALMTNRYAAQGVADRFLLQLRKLSGAVEKTAKDEKLLELLKEGNNPGLLTYFKEIHARYDDPRHGIAQGGKPPPFESWYYLNDRGHMLAASRRYVDLTMDPNYPGRDYFHGAMLRAGKKEREAIHISRIYKATKDGLFRFGISAPVYKGGKVVGVVVATVITDPTMGLDGLHDNRRKAVLYGPMDSNPPHEKVAGPKAPSEFVILIHPAYYPKEKAVPFSAGNLPKARPHPGIDELCEPDLEQRFLPEEAVNKDYVDPVGDRYAAFECRWLAGFAPVGNTELVVIVQQKYEEAIPSDREIIWSGAAVLLGILFVVSIGWLVLQRFTRARERVA
jgi:serine/threonine protein kinase